MAEADSPPERDIKDFKFQQLCKVRVIDSPPALPLKRTSLITASSRYGLTFVGVGASFRVHRTSDFVAKDNIHATDRLKHIITDFPILAEANVGYEVTHLALSADELTLAVAITRPEHAVVYLYDVRNFAGQVSGAVTAFHMIVGEGSEPVNELTWNPVDPNLLIVCYCTGRLDSYSGKNRKASLPAAQAKSVCWSPKGKQLVAGKEDGTLVQYDPDLNEKRKWGSPDVLVSSSEAIDLVWLSTYSFLVAYIAHGADCSEQPTLVLINGSKEGTATYEVFEDICFGTGEERERKYHFNYVQKWEMVLAACSNASEIGIIGKHLENKQVMERWNLDDAARAECPLTEEYADTYPMGFTVDYSSQTPIQLGDDKTHPPSPIMLILTTEGLIIPYHMMYMHKEAQQITSPPQPLDRTGLRTSTGTPALATTQASAVKNLFGSAGVSQPASKPASAVIPFAAASTAGPTKSGSAAAFSFTPSSSQVPATEKSDQSGAIPKFGAAFSFAGTSTPQSGGAPAFTFTPSSGAPALGKSDQSESKPVFGAGFSAGSTNKSGSSAEFSFTSSFGAPAAVASSGAAGAGNKTTTDAAVFKSTAAPASGFGAFALGTKPSESSSQSTTSSFTFQPAGTSAQTTGSIFGQGGQSATPIFGQGGLGQVSTRPIFGQGGLGQSSTPIFGQSSQTTTGAVAPPQMPSASTFAGFGKTPSSGSLGVLSGGATTTADSGASKSGQSFTAASSIFSGMSSATGAPAKTFPADTKPAVARSFPPKSPTSSPPPPSYPTRSQSPEYAPPPPSYPTQPRSPRYAPASQQEDETEDGGGVETAREETDAIDKQFSKSILDEIQHFERELTEFKQSASRMDYAVGSKEDMTNLKKQTEEMEQFCTEIKSTVQEQNKDVQDQQALCLDMFSMVEECRLRLNMHTDKKYMHLLKSRALDPESAGKLEQLQLQYQVLDQGLRDVDLILDTQWEEYQTRKRNKTNRLQTPTNDAIYRVVKSNNNLIIAQKSKIKELEERLKQLKLYNKTSSWNDTSLSITANDTQSELSYLADTLLTGSPVKSASSSSLKEEKTGNKKRLERLREHLSRRHVPVVRSTKPGNLSVLKIPDSQVQTSSFHVSSEQLASMADRPGRAGEFVGMFRRSSSQQQMQEQNQKNKQEKPKNDKDKEITGYLQKIKQKGLEKVQKLFATKPGTAAPPPVQQPAPGMTAPSGVKNSMKLPLSVTNFNEVNGVQFEDITPGDSENEVNDIEDEEEEEEEEYDEDSSGSEGQGFGLPYNRPEDQATGFTSTPNTVETGAKPKVPQNTGVPVISSTPVNRKLFGQENSKPVTTFMFGQGDSEPPVFGATTTTSGTKTTKAAPVANPFTFTPSTALTTSFGNLSEASKSQPGFNFSFSVGTPVFGTTTETQSTVPKVGTQSADTKTGSQTGSQTTGKTGENKTVSKTFGQATASGSVIGQPSDAVVPPGGVKGASTRDTTPKTGQAAVKPGSNIAGQPSPSGASNQAPPQSSVGSSAAKSQTPSPASATAPTATTSAGLLGQSVSAAVTQAGLFGQKSSTTASGVAVLGQAAKTATLTGGLSSSSLSVSTTSAGLFGFSAVSSTTSGSLFGPTTTSTSVISGSYEAKGASTTAVTAEMKGSVKTAATTTGLLGQTSTPATATSRGLLGQPLTIPAATTSGGLLGQPPTIAAATSSGGLFGQPSTVPAATTSGGLFGQSSVSTTSGGLFGHPSITAAAAASGGLPGQPSATTPATTSGGLPGQPTATTAATTSGGLSGQPSAATAATTSGGLSGQPSATTAATTSSGLSRQPSATTAATTSSGPFGQPSVTTAAASSGVLPSTTAAATTSGGLFGQPSATTAATTSGGLSGQPSATTVATTTSGLFGQPSVTTAAATSGGLPSTAAAATTSGGLFGQPSATTAATTSGGLFGQPSATTAASTSGGLFGQPLKTTAASTTGGLFGQPSASTTGGGLFGQPSTAATSSGGLLSATTAATTSGGLFGQPTTATTSAGLFGKLSTTSATSAPGGIFGQSSVTASGTFKSSGGLFGQPSTSTSSGGLFGQPAAPSSSVFGQSTTGSGSLFGQTSGGLFGSSGSGSGVFGAQTTSSGGGVFGQSSTATSGGIFGQNPTSTSTGLFGQSASSSSGGLFGTQSASSSGGGLFGTQSASSSSGGLFGTQSGGSGFGSSTSGTGFGFGSASSSGFGKPAFGQSSVFGTSSSSSNESSGGGGGFFSGLGGKPSAEKASTNVFGSSTFGTSQSGTQGLFGSGTSHAFGAGISSGFSGGGGPFSGGGAGVAATGFGATSQTSSGGFGGPPSFGSSASFGSTPGFGAAPAFGSTPAFSSGNTQTGFGASPVFGGSPGGSTFGSLSQSASGGGGGFAGFASGGSPTFGALAQSSDAPSFGNLSQSPNTGGFGGGGGGGNQNVFGSSPSFTGYRG